MFLGIPSGVYTAVAGIGLRGGGGGGGGSLPAWVGNSGEWSTVAGESLSTSGVASAIDFAGDAGNYTSFFTAWGGGVLATQGVYNGTSLITGTFLVIWGGGHTDYYGNEVYAFGPLEDDVPAWYRLRDATNPPPLNVSTDGSGNPVSRHTYNSIVYDSTNNRLMSTGYLARASDSNGANVVHIFNFSQTNPNVNQPWSTLANTDGAPDVSAYDATTGLVWYHPNGANSVGFYNISTQTPTRSNFKSPGWGSNAMSAIDTSRGIWCIVSNGVTNFYRLNNGTGNDYYTPTTTGTAPSGSNITVLYDSVSDRFVMWNGNGKTLYFLTPPGTNPYQGGNAWTWSSVSPASGSTPDAQQSTGTFGRFQFVNNGSGLVGYLLLNSATSSSYFYRVE